MKNTISAALMLSLVASFARGQYDADALPEVPEGFKVRIVAKEPLLLHPASLCFDARGRLYVGHGPQFRQPKPDTPPDSITILIDEDGDGVMEKSKLFATGLNCIQAMAWRGNDLYVANAPDLTVLRDTDGDDEADEYVLVYTGLGHLRHGLHGLNFAPDGKLYMSQGDSKVSPQAPKPFRDLMHVESDAPATQPVRVFKKDEYKKSWIGQWPTGEGGVLRCDEMGKNLEIFCRGNRNPWDMAYSDTFDWLMTDNDDGPEHDRILMPFYGAHFGKMHAWSYSWDGKDNPPTVPASGMFPNANGSGVGVVFYNAEQFPKEYRGTFLIGDWTQKEILVFKPKWEGALMTHDGPLKTLAMARKTKSLFRPTDIEVGPDGALYVAGWGSGYGSNLAPHEDKDKQVKENEGRVFKIWYDKAPLIAKEKWYPKKREKRYSEWTVKELTEDLHHSFNLYRVNAQDELVRRGKPAEDAVRQYVGEHFGNDDFTGQTWGIWTLARMGIPYYSGINVYHQFRGSGPYVDQLIVQNLRVAVHLGAKDQLQGLRGAFIRRNPRVRFEAAQTFRQIGSAQHLDLLLRMINEETDTFVFYAQWRALAALATKDQLREILNGPRAAVRRAALLALLEMDALKPEEVLPFSFDDDETAKVGSLWLAKVGKGKFSALRIEPKSTEFREPPEVKIETPIAGMEIRYTLDGSAPTEKSAKYEGPIVLEKKDAILHAGLFRGDQRYATAIASYHYVSDEEYANRLFVTNVKSSSGKEYRVVGEGLREGTLVFIDRKFSYETVPGVVQGAAYIRTANDDKRVDAAEHLSFDVNHDVTLHVAMDTRLKKQPAWMKVGEDDGFKRTDQVIKTSDTDFRLFEKEFKAGRIVLGGNAVEGADNSSMYQVMLRKAGSQREPTTIVQAMAAFDSADAGRGKKIFFKEGGVGCFNCHAVEGKGTAVGPDLSDIGLRGDAKHVVESILEPNAKLIEGFLQTVVDTKQGDQYYGLIRSDSAKTLTLYQGNGQSVDIDVKDIVKRRTPNESAMPGNFGEMLTAQETADLAKWMLTLKKENRDGRGVNTGGD